MKWHRVRPRLPGKHRVADTAVQESRLIAASGGLGLRHAADLSHPPTGNRRQVRHEAVSYIVAMITAAIVMAVFLFFVVPAALR
ncbi:MAG TPA: hypothetical protein VJR58_03410 [Vineibacter sp.]|nr:hypothetical protein [Vineibacter sp.]